MKAQQIRLLDVFVIGPVMVVAAQELAARHAALRAALSVFGVATILYNGRNYLIRRREAI